MDILAGVREDIIVALICISLIITDGWASFHLPMGHLYVFFEEVPIRSSAHFSIGMFVFIVVELYELFVYFGK